MYLYMSGLRGRFAKCIVPGFVACTHAVMQTCCCSTTALWMRWLQLPCVRCRSDEGDDHPHSWNTCFYHMCLAARHTMHSALVQGHVAVLLTIWLSLSGSRMIWLVPECVADESFTCSLSLLCYTAATCKMGEVHPFGEPMTHVSCPDAWHDRLQALQIDFAARPMCSQLLLCASSDACACPLLQDLRHCRLSLQPARLFSILRLLVELSQL